MTRSLACKQSSLNQADLKDWPVEERDCLTVRNNGEVNEGQDGESKKEREREREKEREILQTCTTYRTEPSSSTLNKKVFKLVSSSAKGIS